MNSQIFRFLLFWGLFLVLGSTAAQVPTAYHQILSPAGQMYMESIYLPAVTTGPWAPAWSPDGQEIAFSLQGSLWKVPARGGEAVQITSGPHYDSEPAWSPDGRQIAFTRDTGHTLEISVVNADGTNPRQLTRGGAISVNPVWSPTGGSIVYTSTAGAESFNLWQISAAGGEPKPLLVDEHHNFEPSWSPDGKEVVFLSDRGGVEIGIAGRRVYGSGNVWKLTVTDKSLKLLLKEETKYHTRPRWSPDGKKIVYVSHRTGGNEIWMMDAESGIPVQLTRQEAEVFMPSWSPHGRRIAYVSNANHTFTLWTMPAVGGVPSEVRITGLKHRYPVGRLQVVVHEAETGQKTTARVYLQASDGKAYAPLGAFHRHSIVTNEHYFYTTGSFTVELPGGPATVEVMKGFEYRLQKKQVEIVPGETRMVEFTLERFIDMSAQGSYSGDTHLHMNYAGIFGATPEWLLLEAGGEDLNVVNDLITNNDNRLIDLQYFEGKPHALSTANRILYFNQEYRPSFGGHMGLLNLKEYVFPVYNGYPGTPYAADYPADSQILDLVHAQGGVGGYVHPYSIRHLTDRGQDPALQDYRGAREFPVSVALGKVDYYDLMCIWTDEYVVSEVWYRLLNLGFKIPAAAGTDAFSNYWRTPAIGTVRVYVHTGSPLTYGDWIRGLTAGRTFVTNGPLLFLRVQGREPGAELRLPGGRPAPVRVEAEAHSIFPMETLDIVQNGQVVFSVKADDPYRVKLNTTLPVERSGWLAARVTGPEKQHLLMDSFVYAHTSPVYLAKGGEPARSPEAARYFLKWIDRVLELLEERNTFDTPAQKQEVLKLWHRARQVYAGLAEE